MDDVLYRKNKYVTKIPYFTYRDEVWQINTRHGGIYTKMLKAIIDQMLAMLSYDTKLFVCRFDLHQIHGTVDSSHLSTFIQALKARLTREYGFRHIGYAWCREKASAQAQHYHLALMLEGHKIRTTYRMAKLVLAEWIKAGGSSIHRCNYHNVTLQSESLMDAVLHLSYLAKVEGKSGIPSRYKAFSPSRLKARTQKRGCE
ncbi:YagK/YfjJ domain-containing protein [Shewanella atlantica]|uniref:Inovirus Gp2 family protein n=1 Tax=Shewanella atlantica TaxID=271099 RepID=A0A431WGZ6_9GAMM|nr:inovirus-type Gp2 protein [Shewanella atlantica]RTR34745.1 inovirus Gp2 family protein [Shewanella atlantica]